jgi:hypothetical protein
MLCCFRGHNFDTVLPELLKAGVRVMIYAGDQVCVCVCVCVCVSVCICAWLLDSTSTFAQQQQPCARHDWAWQPPVLWTLAAPCGAASAACPHTLHTAEQRPSAGQPTVRALTAPVRAAGQAVAGLEACC